MMDMADWVKPFIVTVFLVVMCIALWTMTVYYLIGFKKGKKEDRYKAYYFNKKLLSISFVLLSINAICSIAGILMVLFKDKEIGITLLWTFAGVSFASFLAEAIFSWITYKYIFIGLEEEKIQFWGEKVLCRKIIEIVKQEEENKLLIFFKYGERNLRKEKVALNTHAATFLIENLHVINFKVLDEISEAAKDLMNKKTDDQSSDIVAKDAKPLQDKNTDKKAVKTNTSSAEKSKTKKVEQSITSKTNDEKQEENKK